MKCNDCIYEKMCEARYEKEHCFSFKDKANFVEVVRCKDCIYGEVDEYGNTWCTFFNGKLREMPNGYCWHGERSEE